MSNSPARSPPIRRSMKRSAEEADEKLNAKPRRASVVRNIQNIRKRQSLINPSMHKNTFVTIAGLSVIAALLLGINIGRKIVLVSQSQPTVLSETTASPTPLVTPSPQPKADRPLAETASISATLSPEVKLQSYRNTGCGYSLEYPATWQYEEFDTQSTNLFNPAQPSEKITIVCSSDLKPPTDSLPTREILLNNVPATYFANQQAADGSPTNAVFAQLSGTNQTIVIAGKGTVFNTALSTFQFTKTSTSSASPQ